MNERTIGYFFRKLCLGFTSSMALITLALILSLGTLAAGCGSAIQQRKAAPAAAPAVQAASAPEFAAVWAKPLAWSFPSDPGVLIRSVGVGPLTVIQEEYFNPTGETVLLWFHGSNTVALKTETSVLFCDYSNQNCESPGQEQSSVVLQPAAIRVAMGGSGASNTISGLGGWIPVTLGPNASLSAEWQVAAQAGTPSCGSLPVIGVHAFAGFLDQGRFTYNFAFTGAALSGELDREVRVTSGSETEDVATADAGSLDGQRVIRLVSAQTPISLALGQPIGGPAMPGCPNSVFE